MPEIGKVKDCLEDVLNFEACSFVTLMMCHYNGSCRRAWLKAETCNAMTSRLGKTIQKVVAICKIASQAGCEPAIEFVKLFEGLM